MLLGTNSSLSASLSAKSAQDALANFFSLQSGFALRSCCLWSSPCKSASTKNSSSSLSIKSAQQTLDLSCLSMSGSESATVLASSSTSSLIRLCAPQHASAKSMAGTTLLAAETLAEEAAAETKAVVEATAAEATAAEATASVAENAVVVKARLGNSLRQGSSIDRIS